MASSVSLAAAFLAGLVSFISPCVLPIVPGYLSFISGVNVAQFKEGGAPRDLVRRVVLTSLAFVLGFSTVFVALGAAATLVGSLLQEHKRTLQIDFVLNDAAVVDFSAICGDYDVYTSKMVEERVEVREGDILIIHTVYHHFGWDMPTANEIRYMVMHPGPDREFAEWAKFKKLRWIGVDCGSADHPMNTIIRDWMPRQARQAEKVFKKKYGMPLAEFSDDTKYQLMHLEMFPFGIVHAECIGGEIDLILNRRVTIGMFPWRFVDGESCLSRCVAMVEDAEYEELMAKKAALPRQSSVTPSTRRMWKTSTN